MSTTREMTAPATKLGIRWTIGDGSAEGFDALRLYERLGYEVTGSECDIGPDRSEVKQSETHGLLGVPPCPFRQRVGLGPDGNQLSMALRALGRHDQRAAVCLEERAIEV
jgi:hypothetical protein